MSNRNQFERRFGNFNIHKHELDRMWRSEMEINGDGQSYIYNCIWCVQNIPSLPQDFATGSALNPANYPIWGTCN